MVNFECKSQLPLFPLNDNTVYTCSLVACNKAAPSRVEAAVIYQTIKESNNKHVPRLLEHWFITIDADID